MFELCGVNHAFMPLEIASFKFEDAIRMSIPFFFFSKKTNKSFFPTFIFISFLIKTIAYCEEDPLTRQTLQNMIASLSPQALAQLNHDLGIQPQELLQLIPVNPNEIPGDIDTTHENFRWDAVILFTIGSSLLFLWAFYREQIIDFFFNNIHRLNTLPQHAWDNYSNIMDIAARSGRLEIIRTFTVNRIETLLSDPETALRAEQALRNAGALSR